MTLKKLEVLFTITITNLKISRVKDYCQSTAVKIGFKAAYSVQDGSSTADIREDVILVETPVKGEVARRGAT